MIGKALKTFFDDVLKEELYCKIHVYEIPIYFHLLNKQQNKTKWRKSEEG